MARRRWHALYHPQNESTHLFQTTFATILSFFDRVAPFLNFDEVSWKMQVWQWRERVSVLCRMFTVVPTVFPQSMGLRWFIQKSRVSVYLVSFSKQNYGKITLIGLLLRELDRCHAFRRIITRKFIDLGSTHIRTIIQKMQQPERTHGNWEWSWWQNSSPFSIKTVNHNGMF